MSQHLQHPKVMAYSFVYFLLGMPAMVLTLPQIAQTHRLSFEICKSFDEPVTHSCEISFMETILRCTVI